MSIVEFAGGPVVKLVNLIGEIEGADAVIRPVTRAFKQLFKLGCELGPPRFCGELPEQGDLFLG